MLNAIYVSRGAGAPGINTRLHRRDAREPLIVRQPLKPVVAAGRRKQSRMCSRPCTIAAVDSIADRNDPHLHVAPAKGRNAVICTHREQYDPPGGGNPRKRQTSSPFEHYIVHRSQQYRQKRQDENHPADAQGPHLRDIVQIIYDPVAGGLGGTYFMSLPPVVRPVPFTALICSQGDPPHRGQSPHGTRHVGRSPTRRSTDLGGGQRIPKNLRQSTHPELARFTPLAVAESGRIKTQHRDTTEANTSHSKQAEVVNMLVDPVYAGVRPRREGSTHNFLLFARIQPPAIESLPVKSDLSCRANLKGQQPGNRILHGQRIAAKYNQQPSAV